MGFECGGNKARVRGKISAALVSASWHDQNRNSGGPWGPGYDVCMPNLASPHKAAVPVDCMKPKGLMCSSGIDAGWGSTNRSRDIVKNQGGSITSVVADRDQHPTCHLLSSFTHGRLVSGISQSSSTFPSHTRTLTSVMWRVTSLRFTCHQAL